MTTRVYIKGDIGACPFGTVKFFDADTDEELILLEVMINVGIHIPNTIHFWRVNSSASETAELVARPPCKASGEKVYQFKLEQTRDAMQSETRLRATATELEVQDDGRLKPNHGNTLNVTSKVSDMMLHVHLRPEEVLEHEAENIMYRLFEPLKKQVIADKKVHGSKAPPSPPIHHGPFPPPRGKIDDAAKSLPAQFCSECYGTGWYTSPITNKRSRCSAGCKSS